MPTTSVNWKSYLELFPERYIKPGPFDDFVRQELSEYQKALALDIGGGRKGTAALKREGVRAWLADPFIDVVPNWMEGNLGSILSISMKFDFIVARGSFNYLTAEEISRIPSLLNPGGVFVFNTFGRVSESGSRPFKSRAGTGTESHLVEGNVVKHQLRFDGNDGLIIEHSFFVYFEHEIVNMLDASIDGHWVEFIPCGENSVHVKFPA